MSSAVAPDGAGAGEEGGGGRSGTLLAADIGTVTKAALQETFAELSASAWKTGVASSTAFRRLRQGAERRLGIEVNIEDPAMRDLFGHVLQVEALLAQVRASALALAQGAAVLAEGQSSPTGAAGAASPVAAGAGGGVDGNKALADSLAMLAQAGCKDAPNALSEDAVGSGSAGPKAGTVPEGLSGDVADALWETLSLSPNACETGSARYRLQRRLEEEVLQLVDQQMALHDGLRQRFRERQSWQESLDQSRREVASLHKSGRRTAQSAAAASGLQPLAGAPGPGALGEADERLKAAQVKVASLDAEVLGQLLDIKAKARNIVARPWAALARIRADFFAALAGRWAPVATALGAGLDDVPRLASAGTATGWIGAPAAVPGGVAAEAAVDSPPVGESAGSTAAADVGAGEAPAGAGTGSAGGAPQAGNPGVPTDIASLLCPDVTEGLGQSVLCSGEQAAPGVAAHSATDPPEGKPLVDHSSLEMAPFAECHLPEGAQSATSNTSGNRSAPTANFMEKRSPEAALVPGQRPALIAGQPEEGLVLSAHGLGENLASAENYPREMPAPAAIFLGEGPTPAASVLEERPTPAAEPLGEMTAPLVDLLEERQTPHSDLLEERLTPASRQAQGVSASEELTESKPSTEAMLHGGAVTGPTSSAPSADPVAEGLPA